MGKSDERVRDGFYEAKTVDLGSTIALRINQAKIGGRTFWEEATDCSKICKWKEKQYRFYCCIKEDQDYNVSFGPCESAS